MVRQANEKDLVRVAEVHISCFPDSFSTCLGKNLLVRFYKEYLMDVPELFLISENDRGEIIGFCMGYYCGKNPYKKRFLQHNILWIGLKIMWLLIIGNRTTWRKIYSVCTSTNSSHSEKNAVSMWNIKRAGDLLSIGVLEKYRGYGIAQKMLDQYFNVLRSNFCDVCLLSVKQSNIRAIRFYARNGFVTYKDSGVDELRLIKQLCGD